MKTSIAFLSFMVCSFVGFCGTLKGAWQMQSDPTSNEKVVMIATENYLSIAVYEQNLFVRTYGGTYQIGDQSLTLSLEFDSKSGEQVGTQTVFRFDRRENEFTLENLAKTTWKRIDTGKNNALSGLWRITARENQEGTMTEMKRGPRKTIKICSDTRFQWIALNTETKEFSGTGGGVFTLIDGKYTETIVFFSRDNKRVGASLAFDATVTDSQWKHSGKSSTGGRVNETWSKEN